MCDDKDIKLGEVEYNEIFNSHPYNIDSLIMNKKGDSLITNEALGIIRFFKAGLDESKTYERIDKVINYMDNNCDLKEIQSKTNKVNADLQYLSNISGAFISILNPFNSLAVIVSLIVLIFSLFSAENVVSDIKLTVILGTYIIIFILTFYVCTRIYKSMKSVTQIKFMQYLKGGLDDIIYYKRLNKEKDVQEQIKLENKAK